MTALDTLDLHFACDSDTRIAPEDTLSSSTLRCSTSCANLFKKARTLFCSIARPTGKLVMFGGKFVLSPWLSTWLALRPLADAAPLLMPFPCR